MDAYGGMPLSGKGCPVLDVGNNYSTLENRNGSWRIEPLRKGFWGRGTVPGCGVTVSLILGFSTYTYI